jgi:hypothetical protein
LYDFIPDEKPMSGMNKTESLLFLQDFEGKGQSV